MCQGNDQGAPVLRVKSRSDPDCYPGQRVPGNSDPVSTMHRVTAVQASPYMLLYRKDLPNLHGLSQHTYDSLSYPAILQARLANYKILFTPKSHRQLLAKSHRMINMWVHHSLSKGSPSGVPSAGKLEPKSELEGEWAVKCLASTEGKHTKIFHVNRLPHCLFSRPNTTARRDDEADFGMRDDLSPPGIEH